ncbi:mechanosensitive ion channel family protein [Nocardioidaceae bacterium]|nr:mechanosensitive ion channel family protein [Nocardioidaceae bacterium]
MVDFLLFRVADGTGAGGGSAGVVERLSDLMGGLDLLLTRVIAALVLLVLAYALGKLVAAGLHAYFKPRQTPSFARVISKLVGWFVSLLLVAAAIVMLFPSVSPVNMLAGLGFFSVAAAFAFQDILENLLSGLLLILRQPFRSGDQIDVGEVSGTVEAISIRETRLRTFDGQLVLIPNRDVYKATITVRTHFENRRQNFVVGIAYENDAEEARALILGALTGVEEVDHDRDAEALVVELNTSTVDIDVRFWCAPDQHSSRVALSAAIIAVKKRLDEAGVEMPCDIVALQATPSFKAAVQDSGELTPGGSLRAG